MSGHHRAITTLTCLLIGTAALASCTSSSSTPSPTQTTQNTTPSTPAAPSMMTTAASTTPVTAPGATASVTPTTSPCATTELNVQLGPGAGAGMSQQRLSLAFTNTGHATCTLDGHPGVSFVAGDDGHQVGAPAQRGGHPTRVVLAAGATAHADLDIVTADAFDTATCQPTPVTGLRIYPPDQTTSIFIAYPATGCASTDTAVNVLNIGPVQDGTGATP